ncbi:MAG: ABC transporter substrate-binding protein, partial [Acidimicrobiia bacterium]|nr:ABC transporter substrate-binding protein [Acidimicrobiia bacterium]
MPRSRPGHSAAVRRLLLVGIVPLVPLVAAGLSLLLSACGEEATSAVDDEPVSQEPATGSNERFQATEAVPESLPQGEEPAAADPESQFPPAPDGYLVWAHPVQPVGLAVADQVDGGLHTTSWIREGLWESLYRVDVERRYQPELLADDAVVTANENGTVSIAFQLRSGLRWSDGESLTAEDVAYTHRILMEGCLIEADGSAIDVSNENCVYPLRDRTGYDLVTSFDVVDDTRFTIEMAAFYPDWRALYPHIFAAHAFGDDAATVAANLEGLVSGGSLPSSGAFVIESWENGSMRLARNPNHQNGSGGDGVAPAGVQINFVASESQATEAVAGGSADLAVTAPSIELLEGVGDYEISPMPALEYEHLGLNLLDPHLADPIVRQAVLSAIGRTELATIYGGLVGRGVSADGVGNAFWLPGQVGYQDHQPEAREADAAQAFERLESAGYARGGDGVFSHPERGPLRLRLLTNGGDSIRVALQQRIVDQLEAGGFAVQAEQRDGGAFLTEGPFAEAAIDAAHSAGAGGDSDVWDLVLFAWAGGPWPGLQSGAFRAESGANPYGFADPEFDTESSRCDGLVDDGERATCYQELDTYITTLDKGNNGIVIVPLIERPQFVVYNQDRFPSPP